MFNVSISSYLDILKDISFAYSAFSFSVGASLKILEASSTAFLIALVILNPAFIDNLIDCKTFFKNSAAKAKPTSALNSLDFCHLSI